MDIGNMLNSKNAAAAQAAAEAQLQQQLAHAAQLRNAGVHTPASQHGDPHMYGQNATQPLHPMTNLSTNIKYEHAQSPHGMQMMPNGYMSNAQENTYTKPESASSRLSTDSAPKAFACSTCAKGFARRSDLARHGLSQL